LNPQSWSPCFKS